AEDYQAARQSINQLITKGSSSTSSLNRISYISSSATEVTLNNNIEAAESDLKEYKEAHAELSGLKALRDSDVREAYDKYSDTHDNYVKFADQYISSAKQVLPAIAKCETASRATASV